MTKTNDRSEKTYTVWRLDSKTKSKATVEATSKVQAAKEFAECNHIPDDVSDGGLELVVQDPDGDMWSVFVTIEVAYDFDPFVNGKHQEETSEAG